MCRPILVGDVPSPFLKIVGGVNICVQGALGGADCIPNDIVLGTPPDANASDSQALSPLMLLVTGPNMGGKSTLLRQACLTALMAHLGCHVPAQQCSLSPVDRIFTRVGANDAIMARALSPPAASCSSLLPSAPSFAALTLNLTPTSPRRAYLPSESSSKRPPPSSSTRPPLRSSSSMSLGAALPPSTAWRSRTRRSLT